MWLCLSVSLYVAVDAPEDWEFKDYNTNHKKIFDFLEADGGSKEAVVPYRENRAVIFHSNFFHTTDTLCEAQNPTCV